MIIKPAPPGITPAASGSKTARRGPWVSIVCRPGRLFSPSPGDKTKGNLQKINLKVKSTFILRPRIIINLRIMRVIITLNCSKEKYCIHTTKCLR